MSCACAGAAATFENTVQVTIKHCSGDTVVFVLDPAKYPNVIERAGLYMKLCYVHEPSCTFKMFAS